jgi:flagellar FliL protein
VADSDTSKTSTRAEDEAAIRDMRNGGPAEKKSKKKLVVLLLAELLVAGGGAAAYKFMFAKELDAPQVAKLEKPKPVEPVELIYIDLDPLFVPFKTEEGRRHKIVVILSLEVGRARLEDKWVRSLMPRLREAYVRALTSRPFPGTEDGSIETVYLKNRIRAENIRILGSGVVNDVLVRDIRVVPG